MSCKSAIYTVNNTITELQPSSQVPFGSVIRRFGPSVQLDGSAITLNGAGYYKVDCSITMQASAAGEVAAAIYANGVLVSGLTAIESAAGADSYVNLHICGLVRLQCCGGASVLTLNLMPASIAATVTNIACVVEKL